MKTNSLILLTVCAGFVQAMAQQTNQPSAAAPTNPAAAAQPPAATAQAPAGTNGVAPAAPPPSAPAQRSAAELEKLAMPVALHPDPLIAGPAARSTPTMITGWR